jgi:hypothetical protein
MAGLVGDDRGRQLRRNRRSPAYRGCPENWHRRGNHDHQHNERIRITTATSACQSSREVNSCRVLGKSCGVPGGRRDSRDRRPRSGPRAWRGQFRVGRKAAKEAGATVINGDDRRAYREVATPGRVRLKTAPVHSLVLDSDVFFNVPLLKHHSGALMTVWMKNLMGVVWDRGFHHRNDLHRTIVDSRNLVPTAVGHSLAGVQPVPALVALVTGATSIDRCTVCQL